MIAFDLSRISTADDNNNNSNRRRPTNTSVPNLTSANLAGLPPTTIQPGEDTQKNTFELLLLLLGGRSLIEVCGDDRGHDDDDDDGTVSIIGDGGGRKGGTKEKILEKCFIFSLFSQTIITRKNLIRSCI